MSAYSLQAPPHPSEVGFPLLSAEEQLCAIYEASRKFRTLRELAEHFGRSQPWLLSVRGKPEYQFLVKDMLRQIANRVTQDAADATMLFDQEIRPSVATLIEVRDDPFGKGGDRVKAALGLLDRAPSAPRAKETKEVQRVLSIPISQMRAIKAALSDEGEGEMIELVEGRDFTAEAAEAESSTGQIVPREIL